LQSVELGGHISFNHQVGIQLVLVVHDNGDILIVRTQLSVILAVGLSIPPCLKFFSSEKKIILFGLGGFLLVRKGI
jgi:hypothetical protein